MKTTKLIGEEKMKLHTVRKGEVTEEAPEHIGANVAHQIVFVSFTCL
jgi:hypothetical protein